MNPDMLDRIATPKKERHLISGIVVTLDHLTTPEDAENVLRAIQMIRCVAEVTLVKGGPLEENHARRRAIHDIKKSLQVTLDSWE